MLETLSKASTTNVPDASKTPKVLENSANIVFFIRLPKIGVFKKILSMVSLPSIVLYQRLYASPARTKTPMMTNQNETKKFETCINISVGKGKETLIL